MALIIEDGTIVDGADSFVTVEFARNYAAAYGYELPVDDTELEVVLRQGGTYLSLFDGSISGSKVDALQTMVYPRESSYLISGSKKTFLESDYIPLNIKHAQVIAAASYAAGDDIRSNDDGKSVASEAVSGAVSISYFDNGKTSDNVQITAAIDAMKPLFSSVNNLSVRLKRVL